MGERPWGRGHEGEAERGRAREGIIYEPKRAGMDLNVTCRRTNHRVTRVKSIPATWNHSTSRGRGLTLSPPLHVYKTDGCLSPVPECSCSGLPDGRMGVEPRSLSNPTGADGRVSAAGLG